jgi:hypothetical protein
MIMNIPIPSNSLFLSVREPPDGFIFQFVRFGFGVGLNGLTNSCLNDGCSDQRFTRFETDSSDLQSKRLSCIVLMSTQQ